MQPEERTNNSRFARSVSGFSPRAGLDAHAVSSNTVEIEPFSRDPTGSAGIVLP